ncbi:MAG: AraC family transcriptional regulator [Pseudomonadota bacterium]
MIPDILDEPYVRATSLIGVEEFACELGISLRNVLREVKIADAALDDPTMLISMVSFNRLLVRLSQLSGDPDIGLKLVLNAKRAMDDIGPLALILKMGDTTGECVKNALRYLKYHTNAIKVEVVKDTEKGIGEFRYMPLFPLTDVRQLTENAIGVACVAMRFLLSDDGSKPHMVAFQHSKPADDSLHNEFFECEVIFNHPTNSLYFDLKWLELETIGADHQIANVVYSFLQSEIDKVEAKLTTTASISSAISQLLPSGHVGIDLIAHAMNVSPKTIQRRLKNEGTSYSEILHGVRKETATRLLTETGIPVSNVAGLCGYSSPAAFNLAFKGWHNCTPQEFRTRQKNKPIKADNPIS